jgi:acetate kinase
MVYISTSNHVKPKLLVISTNEEHYVALLAYPIEIYDLEVELYKPWKVKKWGGGGGDSSPYERPKTAHILNTALRIIVAENIFSLLDF